MDFKFCELLIWLGNKVLLKFWKMIDFFPNIP